MSPAVEKEVQESVRFAFFCKNMTYCSELQYDSLCPKEMNDAQLREPNLQTITKENQKVLYNFRALNKLPPVLINHTTNAGFEVRAAADLPELTILCEYIGEVKTEKMCVNSPSLFNNDSIMELLSTPRTDTTLNVVPVKYSNIARFFNGINNS